MMNASSRTCVILQPGYLPWLGFFEQMARADEFVYLDDVQFDKHGWRNRNRIKGPGGAQWLTVPVRLHGLDQPPIHEVLIDPARPQWAAKHLQAIRTCYGPSPFFDCLFPGLADVLSRDWTHIAELDIAVAAFLCEKLGLSRRVHRSSALGVEGDRCERLARICRRLGCDVYYSGAAAREYLDVSAFENAGIHVEFQDYRHPEYPQRFGGFVSHLSVVDLMFHCGPDSLSIITGVTGHNRESLCLTGAEPDHS